MGHTSFVGTSLLGSGSELVLGENISVIFTDRPIVNLENLYGRGHRLAVEKLREAIENCFFATVLGARRVGKTSVVKTVLNHYRYKFLFFDLSPYMGLRAVSFRSLVPAEIGFDEESLSGEAQLNLAIIKFKLRKVKVTGEVFQSSLLSLLRELNSKYDRLVVVFDEAQVLAFVKGLNYPGLLQFIHNNYRNIVVVLTGSMPGILEKIVSPTSAEEPGFARYIKEIFVPRWSREETVEFLRKGFEAKNIPYREEELHEVYEELSGIPGFISYYGLSRLEGKSHREALSKAENYAISQWMHDLKAFLQIYNSPLYIHVLSVLAKTLTGASWTELETELERKLGKPVGKSTLHRILANLQKAGILEKQGSKYTIPDRTLRKTINKQKTNPNWKYNLL